jgi:metal-responsive CopG/Arc/MetJ family transcriptional regulator
MLLKGFRSELFTLDKTEKVGITLPGSILKRMDKVRGDIPRSTFIKRAIEQLPRKEGK